MDIMNKILHIVNGTTVIDIMKQAKLSGDFVAWDDFLHEGPVPKAFSLQQLSKIRAYFMDKQGYSQLDEISKKFEERNTLLERHQEYDKVILWFEQDLYDQLQLLQVLSWFKEHLAQSVALSLILTDKYFGDYSFHKLRQLLLYEQTIQKEQLELAQKAWSAFCAPTPMAWFRLLREPTSVLPFLKGSVKRLLEEYPNTKNGLSRTAHQALLSISHGKTEPKEIFIHSQKYEDKQFIADVIFWKILDDFIEYKLILSDRATKALTITPLGKNVLDGKQNWIAIKNIDYWIGGVNLSNDNLWCWDIKNKTIANYYYSKILSTLLPVKQKRD